MIKWYANDDVVIRLDDVTCVKRGDIVVGVRHGLTEQWDFIRGKGENKKQAIESAEKIYKTIQEILIKTS